MQTWAILAVKHATLISGIGLGTIPAMSWDSVGGFAVGLLLAGVGFAALNSRRRARTCSVPQPDAIRAGRPEARSHDGGRIARARRWVDGLLTGMLNDDTDLVTAAPESWGTDPQQAEQEASEPATAGRDSAQPDLEQPEPEPPEPAELAWSAERTFAPDPAARPHQNAGEATSAVAVPREFGREQEPARPRLRSDEGFWGLDEAAASASGNGHRSNHRHDGAASDSGPQDGGRGKPRHAAPPASFGVTLGRRLSSPRLTSRSAAHAGG